MKRATRPCLALAASMALVACGAASHRAHSHTAQAARSHGAAPRASQWPDASEYNTITTAVRVRDQALHLKAWNQKAYAAQLGLTTLVTLEGTFRPGKCAQFVAHIYDELMDLNQAYPGENWQPLVADVARDPTVASQCRAPVPSLGV